MGGDVARHQRRRPARPVVSRALPTSKIAASSIFAKTRAIPPRSPVDDLPNSDLIIILNKTEHSPLLEQRYRWVIQGARGGQQAPLVEYLRPPAQGFGEGHDLWRRAAAFRPAAEQRDRARRLRRPGPRRRAQAEGACPRTGRAVRKRVLHEFVPQLGCARARPALRVAASTESPPAVPNGTFSNQSHRRRFRHSDAAVRGRVAGQISRVQSHRAA